MSSNRQFTKRGAYVLKYIYKYITGVIRLLLITILYIFVCFLVTVLLIPVKIYNFVQKTNKGSI